MPKKLKQSSQALYFWTLILNAYIGWPHGHFLKNETQQNFRRIDYPLPLQLAQMMPSYPQREAAIMPHFGVNLSASQPRGEKVNGLK